MSEDTISKQSVCVCSCWMAPFEKWKHGATKVVSSDSLLVCYFPHMYELNTKLTNEKNNVLLTFNMKSLSRTLGRWHKESPKGECRKGLVEKWCVYLI